MCWWEMMGEGVLWGFLLGACFGFLGLDATVMAQSCALREETDSLLVLFPGDVELALVAVPAC